jgi:hypothetical protein
MDPQQGTQDAEVIVTESAVVVPVPAPSTVPASVPIVEEVVDPVFSKEEESSSSESLKKRKVKVADESSAIWQGVAKIQVVVPAILGAVFLFFVPLWVGSSLAIPAGLGLLGLLGLCFLGYAVYSIDIKPVSNPDKT